MRNDIENNKAKRRAPFDLPEPWHGVIPLHPLVVADPPSTFLVDAKGQALAFQVTIAGQMWWASARKTLQRREVVEQKLTRSYRTYVQANQEIRKVHGWPERDHPFDPLTINQRTLLAGQQRYYTPSLHYRLINRAWTLGTQERTLRNAARLFNEEDTPPGLIDLVWRDLLSHSAAYRFNRKVIAQYPQPTALALQEVVAKQGPDAIHKFMNGDRQLIEQVHQSLHHYERDSDSERGQDVLANIERATKDT